MKTTDKTAQHIPFRPALFWDTNPKQLDINKHAKYIIERIMDFGNENETRWIRRYYPKSLLAMVARKSRVLGSSSKTLWTLLTSK